jgi:ABC-type multidrug transport system permease subunit
MIADALLGLLHTAIGWISTAAASLVGGLTFPAGFSDAVGYLKSLDRFLPVTEFLAGFSFLLSYFGVVWGLKWVMKIVDWIRG